MEREIAQWVEREIAQWVEREIAQWVEREIAQWVEREIAQWVEREIAQWVEREIAQWVDHSDEGGKEGSVIFTSYGINTFGEEPQIYEMKCIVPTSMDTLSERQQGIFYIHHPKHRIAQSTAFVNQL